MYRTPLSGGGVNVRSGAGAERKDWGLCRNGSGSLKATITNAPVATRGYSCAPRAEKAPLMTTETTAQHEEGNFEMAQNVKLAEPKEIRATMNKADVCRELYNAAEFHLFGAGSWPADQESSACLLEIAR